MLVLSQATLAKVEDLFHYKKQGFSLDYFPGYSDDQWGIKAHNRPWIEAVGKFESGQKIIEVGGAYSLLPKYLSDKYALEAWIADDFGRNGNEDCWSRWGDPDKLPIKYPTINYTFENFGGNSEKHPSCYFDRIYSVSTLEHISENKRLAVIKDMNRCLKKGGMQLHTIDVSMPSLSSLLLGILSSQCNLFKPSSLKRNHSIMKWIKLFELSGAVVKCELPGPLDLINRETLVESPDVVYRFYPPNNEPKNYNPEASLLLVIEKV